MNDFIGKGFHRLDPDLIQDPPPKIKWGKKYLEEWSDEQKIKYLEKLACTMNHAAYLIQKERDELQAMCEKKEAQIIAMDKALRQNDILLQQEVTRMNEQRQDYNANVSKLNRKIRELSHGDPG